MLDPAPSRTALVISLALALLVGVAGWQVTRIPESAIRMAVGPALVPALVVAALALAVAAYVVSMWRGRQPLETGPEPGALSRVLSLMGAGVVFAAGVTWLGFILPATLCGMGVARAFDARLGWRSALICGCIAAAFWLVFARLLGVGLGPALPFGF
ncbi:MAG: tripartite tricarboxylate transporter TctB family protein [Betaproteobacteria bacterium]